MNKQATQQSSTVTEIHPFKIDVPQSDLDDLRERLAGTRWTNELPPEPTEGRTQTGPFPLGWEHGVRLDFVKRLVARWRDRYDWREWEARINAFIILTSRGQRVPERQMARARLWPSTLNREACG